MGGIEQLAETVATDMEQRLPGQRKTQRGKLALLVATMLQVRSANLMDVAACLPRPAERLDSRYQWIKRVLANARVVSDAVMAPSGREVLARLARCSRTGCAPCRRARAARHCGRSVETGPASAVRTGPSGSRSPACRRLSTRPSSIGCRSGWRITAAWRDGTTACMRICCAVWSAVATAAGPAVAVICGLGTTTTCARPRRKDAPLSRKSVPSPVYPG